MSTIFTAKTCPRCGVASISGKLCVVCSIVTEHEIELTALHSELDSVKVQRDAALESLRMSRDKYLQDLFTSFKQLGVKSSLSQPIAVLNLLRRIASDGCGCSSICQCNSQETLKIWKEEVQQEATNLLNAIETQLAEPKESV